MSIPLPIVALSAGRKPQLTLVSSMLRNKVSSLDVSSDNLGREGAAAPVLLTRKGETPSFSSGPPVPCLSDVSDSLSRYLPPLVNITMIPKVLGFIM